MSECMIIDETNDQIETCKEVTVKDFVGFILEDILCSALAISDKGCNQIGDFNTTENFCQPPDQLPPELLKNIKTPQNIPAANLSSQLNSGENAYDSISYLTAKESIDLVLQNLVFKDEKVKNLHECKVISEEILADNELLIQNGQIRLESNRPDEKSGLSETSNQKHCLSENVAVTDNPEDTCDFSTLGTSKDKSIEQASQENEKNENSTINTDQDERENERPFTPFTTEKLRQSILQAWGNGKPSIIGGWDGDMSAQMEEISHLIKELSSVQVLPDIPVDPNRPRACAFAEEDVKRMIKEIEEINFNQASNVNSDDPETTYNIDGQGDADLESKSCHNKLPKTSKLGSKSEILSDDSKSLKREKQQKSKLSVNIQDKTYENVLPCDKDEEEYLAEINMTGSSCITLMSRGSNEAEGKEKEVKEFSNSSKKSDVSCKASYSDTRFSFGSKQPVEGTINELSPEYEIKAEDMSKSSSKIVGSMISNKETNSGLVGQKVIGSQTQIIETMPSPTQKQQNEMQEFELPAPTTKESDFRNSFKSKVLDTTADKPHVSPVDIKADFETEATSLFERQSKTIRNTKSASNANEDSSASLTSRSEHVTSSEGKLVSNNSFFEEEYSHSKTVKTKKAYEEETSPLQVLPLNNKSNAKNQNNADKSFIEDSKNSEINFEAPKKNYQDDSGIIKCQDETSTESENKGNSEDKSTKQQENNDSSTSPSSQNLDASSSKTKTEDQSPQQFKLHSNKMYFGADFEPANQGVNESILTDADEDFIDRTENVLQIIDPPEGDNDDEEPVEISFTLANETPPGYANEALDPQCNLPQNSQDDNKSRDEIHETKKKYSGMSAIGPIKNAENDPKDLTAPDVDFGKMTHITSSRQLAKDFFGSELKTVPSIRITRGNEPDDVTPILGESSHIEVTSLVNRDIASLTKVQKVREVMSYYPKPEEDFEDDDSLPRPRLDLKDVESTTDERFKVPDVSIPLLSFDVSNTNTDITNEYIQNIHLVLSANCFNDEELLQGGRQVREKNSATTPLHQDVLDIKNSQLLLQNIPNKRDQNVIPVLFSNTEPTEFKQVDAIEQDPTEETLKVETHSKYCTLSRVLQKASNKFTRKDSDVILRNSKSLPRENTKMSATESIRSFLNDHHSSATNVLSKSRSLLKNTQNIFKSLSQNRFGTQDSLPDKSSSPETDDCSGGNVESKLSSFLKKEDFKKAKNLIKSKMEKTFKKFESENNKDSEHKTKSERDLTVAVRNEENYRIDKMENFRKFLPKSPMVYKSQFVKSQSGIQSENSSNDKQTNGEDKNELMVTVTDGETCSKEIDEIEASQELEQAVEDLSEERLEKEESSWIEGAGNESDLNIQNDSQDVGYIVMETIQGLPTTDLESPLSETRNQIQSEESPEENDSREKDLPQENALDSPNPLLTTMQNNDVHQTTPTSPQKNESKGSIKLRKEKKVALKNKKLSARFRSFWCSAFGRVKTPPEKTEPYMKSQPNEENTN